MAISGGMGRNSPGSGWLSRMVKPLKPDTSRSLTSTESMRARGGGEIRKLQNKGHPPLETSPRPGSRPPARYCARYRSSPGAWPGVYTNGRKPTPCTMPRTRRKRAVFSKGKAVSFIARELYQSCPNLAEINCLGAGTHSSRSCRPGRRRRSGSRSSPAAGY